MIYMTANMSQPAFRRLFGNNPQIGMLMTPVQWRQPFTGHYACDNAMFGAFKRGDHGWWEREGEKCWLKMIDKLPPSNRPRFVVLPDVVTEWEATLERAHHYRPMIWKRRLQGALALQDGAERNDWRDVKRFAPGTVFIGGSTEWKWWAVKRVSEQFRWLGVSIHVGRVNAVRHLWHCRDHGVTSCDGTGINIDPLSNLPKLMRGLNETDPQTRFAFE